MEPITQGMTGAAVEDIQERLVSIGYNIDQGERDRQEYGISTTTAVTHFRLNMGLSLGGEVDSETWVNLVDESYKMGDRTLYLRLPNFHGADVRQLQHCLNILGFSAGEVDGYYGPFTETAVRHFQESIGELPDGMVFPDTFDAIERLHHVWAGKSANGPHPLGSMGFARAAGVLESVSISITAEDPISRNVAGRVWNLASATNEKSGLDMYEKAIKLPMRIRTACESSKDEVPVVRIQLSQGGPDYNGTFTVSDAQTYAVMLLDALCAAFDG